MIDLFVPGRGVRSWRSARNARSVRSGRNVPNVPSNARRLRAAVGAAALCVLGAACAGKQPVPPRSAGDLAAVAKPPTGSQVGPPVTLLPAPTARPLELCAVSVGSFDRLLESGVRLAGEAVPLPMTATGLRDMLLSQAGLAPEVAADLDLGSPAGAAVVALDDKGASGVVLAVPARGPAEAERIIDALGRRVMTRGPITLVANGAKSHGWVLRAGSVVVLSDEMEALIRGAMLALEARHAGPDDVTTTIYPEAVARAHGTDVKSAIAAVIEQARAAQKENNGLDLRDGHFYETAAKMLELFSDAERIELGLSIDPAKGLILGARLYARPGSALEATARQVTPFEIDPAVLEGSGPRFAVGAMSLGALWRDMLDHYRQRLAADKGKGAAAAFAYYDAFLGGLSGQQSGAVWLHKEAPYFSGAFSTPLKDTATAAKVGAALQRLDARAMAALTRAELGEMTSLFDLSARRETVGRVRAMHVRMTLKKGLAPEGGVWRRVFGPGFDVYQGVAGARVVGTFGRDAGTRLAAIASGKPAPIETSGPFVEARAAAKGRDALYYADLAPVLGLLGTFSSDPRAAALARAGSGPIPLVYTAGGDGVGKTFTMDLTLPVTAFKSIGGLVAAGMSARN
jgi:hypothetical protein